LLLYGEVTSVSRSIYCHIAPETSFRRTDTEERGNWT